MLGAGGLGAAGAPIAPATTNEIAARSSKVSVVSSTARRVPALARRALPVASLVRLLLKVMCRISRCRSPREDQFRAGSYRPLKPAETGVYTSLRAGRLANAEHGGGASVLPLHATPASLARKSERDRGALAGVLVCGRVGHRDRAFVRQRGAGGVRGEDFVLGRVGNREV